jgi:nitrate reductase NapE component
MKHRRLALAVVVVSALASRSAAADTYHLKSPSKVETEKGSKLELPPGYFLDEKTWQERDATFKKAQEDATRFKAENESLRKSAKDDYPWLATGVVGAFGVAVGIFAVVTRDRW